VSTVELGALQRQNDRLRRRRVVNRGMELFAWLAGAAGVAILVVIVWSVAARGASKLNLKLFTKALAPIGISSGSEGLANAFAGSLVIVGIATAMALPVGILVAIYVNEFAPRRIRNSVGLVLDVLNGIPAIVIGIFVYGLIVVGHGANAFAGSFALGVMMLPLVARSTIEVLALVPNSLREAALGIGSPRWRATLGIVVPQAIGGILTGAVLAVARVSGETAPLLLVTSVGVGQGIRWNPGVALQSVPVAIFELSDSPFPSDHAIAWAGALVLILFILVTSLSARWLANRSRRKLSRAAR
jgi:phosphate transport system permease protein